MNTIRPALGRGSKEILEEVGMEVVEPEPKIESEPAPLTSQPQPAAGVTDPPELRAATAIPAIVEILQDVPAQYHNVIFKSVVGILSISQETEVKPWEVTGKPVDAKKRHWWNRS